MISARFRMLILALGVLLGAASGCSENPTEPARPQIVAGTSREMATTTISPAGGSVTLDLPGDSLDGLSIDVPQGAYDEARTFQISTAQIERHDLGPDFNPLTPLIKIRNGGGYSEEPMTLTIPCTIPEGHFAMAFIYDRATGRIEGMPTVSMGQGSITVLTYNFDFSNVAAPAKRTFGSGSAVQVGETEVVISSIPEAKLNDPYDSDFRPGVDDWQFPNYGSHLYLGHCSGMSATSLWYYSDRKQKRGDQPLNGRLDNDGGRLTPKIWADDVAGFRFTGLAQVDLPWMTRFQQLLVSLENNLPAKVTYNLFAYAIRITKQPQFVWIVAENGVAEGSHAMVIYKIENGRIYIADPNYSGDLTRHTEFSLGQFIPYYSGPNAQNVGAKYTKFHYLAQSSIVNTSVFAQQWPSVIEGTIGADRYPQFVIKARNDEGEIVPLTDGFTTSSGVLQTAVESSGPRLKIIDVYDKNENRISFSNGSLALPFGEHLVGFHVTDLEGRWAGFEWITVISKDDGTTPPPDPIPGSTCSVTLTIEGSTTTVLDASYSVYRDTIFEFDARIPGGYLTVRAHGFNGPGTYPLYTTVNVWDGGTFLVENDGADVAMGNAGSLTIHLWDTKTVIGTVDFRSERYNGTTDQMEVYRRASAQFQCSR